MKLVSARRLGAFVALGLAAAVVPAVAPQASAQTPTIAHNSCTIDGKAATLSLLLNTTAPASSPAGTKIPGKFFAVVTFPAAFVTELKEQSNGFIKALNGSFTVRMTTNGANTPVAVSFPSTAVPSGNTAMKVTASGALPSFTPQGPGTVTYKAGTTDPVLNITLGFQSAVGADPVTTRNGSCKKPANAGSTIDTVNVTAASSKVPSRIGTGLEYKTKTDKLKVAAKVIPTPNQLVTGNVNFSVYKAGKRIRNVTKKLTNNAAVTTFSGKIKKKGKYTVKFTFYGSPQVKASTATRTFRIK